MTRTRLTDMQLVLLTTAAGRSDGGLLPPAESLGSLGARMRRALASLLKAELVEERLVAAAEGAWRVDGNRPFGLFITAAGRERVGVDAAPPAAELPRVVDEAPALAGASKKDAVLALMRRGEGATLAELVAATGWLPHTTRAALTGLRKKGHGIVRGKRDNATVYTLAA